MLSITEILFFLINIYVFIYFVYKNYDKKYFEKLFLWTLSINK